MVRVSRRTLEMMPAPYKLSSVTVERFMSFQGATLEIKDLNVLIGPNGAGKSNFLALFDMLGRLVDQRLGQWLGSRAGWTVSCTGARSGRRT